MTFLIVVAIAILILTLTRVRVRTHTAVPCPLPSTLHRCVVLASVTKCAVGKKFVAAENGNSGKCEACPSGTFNANNDASTKCAKHNPCTDTTVKEAGTASEDAVCNPGI